MIKGIIDMAVVWLSVYAALGALFAVYFIGWGARAFDPGHEHSSFAARAVLAPGVMALWPYLLVRMLTGARFQG